ncbi:MAG: GyrI-like domain-containing protein [Proteobacteria bacterium]|nr:GyrI-like domain-containing protein [Pseudomonadota bacterium]
MEPRIEILKPKKLVGIHMGMSLSNNKTRELWQQFMPRRAEVKNRLTADFISMQKYGENWNFSPDALFEKWATVEVSSFAEVPPKMETYLLQGGKYAVFIHCGPASAAAETMQYIFGQWLPQSLYILDSREHFEVLPERYSPVDPNATEEIWVPVRV